jgi:pimeloyl-ACP methyl ester carboxylesterase
MTSSFVSVGSARVAYRVLGMGPAVLLVNGTGGGDGHWGDLIERLARSRTVVTLDYSARARRRTMAPHSTCRRWPGRWQR